MQGGDADPRHCECMGNGRRDLAIPPYIQRSPAVSGKPHQRFMI